jgi:hypothetical protein
LLFKPHTHIFLSEENKMSSMDFYMICDLDFFHAAGDTAIPKGINFPLEIADCDDFMSAYMMGGEL